MGLSWAGLVPDRSQSLKMLLGLGPYIYSKAGPVWLPSMGTTVGRAISRGEHYMNSRLLTEGWLTVVRILKEKVHMHPLHVWWLKSSRAHPAFWTSRTDYSCMLRQNLKRSHANSRCLLGLCNVLGKSESNGWTISMTSVSAICIYLLKKQLAPIMCCISYPACPYMYLACVYVVPLGAEFEWE